MGGCLCVGGVCIPLSYFGKRVNFFFAEDLKNRKSEKTNKTGLR